jgi:hypothetical protein
MNYNSFYGNTWRKVIILSILILDTLVKKVLISHEMCRIRYHLDKSLSQDKNNPTLHKTPEEWRTHLHQGVNLKSHKDNKVHILKPCLISTEYYPLTYTLVLPSDLIASSFLTKFLYALFKSPMIHFLSICSSLVCSHQ